MANQAVKVVRKTREPGRDSFQIADGVVVYEGMLAGIDATTGYLEHWADGANDCFAGVVLGGDDRAKDGVLTGETSDTPPPEARVDTSGTVLMHLSSINNSPVQGNVGDPVYCGTSNPDDITTNSSGRNHPIGFIVRWRTATDVDVQLFSMAHHVAQRVS